MTDQEFNAPAFPFYWRDWLSSRKVALMSLAAQGLYVRLLCLSWIDGGLPTNSAHISALCGNPAEFNAIWAEVATMFRERDGLLINDRLDALRSERIDFQESKREGGRKAQEIRRAKLQAELKAELPANGVANAPSSSASASASSLAPAISPSSPKEKIAAPPLEIPFKSEIFEKAWDEWGRHLTEKKIKRTSLAIKQQLEKCKNWGESDAIAAIKSSIAGNYQGLFPAKDYGAGNRQGGGFQATIKRAADAELPSLEASNRRKAEDSYAVKMERWENRKRLGITDPEPERPAHMAGGQ